MFLEVKKAKGKYVYIYLSSYSVRKHYSRKKQSVFSFGNKEKAVKRMLHWKNNFTEFPAELLEIGCGLKDLEEWINTIETGITKTGKQLKAIK